MKNKNLIISLVVGLVVLISAGALVLPSGKKAVPVEVDQAPMEEKVTTIKPEDIGLILTASSDNRKVILEVENTKDISGLDYQLSYISKGNIPRGIIGRIDIKVAGKPATQEIILGTCSDVCHYDQEISDIKLILKVAKTDGTTSQVEKTLQI